ncbi:hypothetical protein [Oscillatoria sp. FACHB-1406]|uniref:hypothetical protein n=1 Tax=Oscillatoria sp. FACHB-1406 TaxID=2692846 RepID=UPI00168417A7|nr:hypothetical protein [Oscillatoria sp. FACHB-1406]MBD2576926.1 hypothetical protein [Oscillatoria sp. FACHB-1406]
MTYVEPPREPYAETVAQPAVASSVFDYHDRVRWGPIVAGLVIAIATQLVLSALGGGLGLTAGATGTDAGAVGIGVGIWAIISLLLSLFIGGWVAGKTSGPMNSKTALLNGAILWATTLALGSWLLAMGVSGTFGAIAANAGEVINQVQESGGIDPNAVPSPTVQQAQNAAGDAAKAAWSFLLGSLLGLVAAMAGSSVGATKPRVVRVD